MMGYLIHLITAIIVGTHLAPVVMAGGENNQKINQTTLGTLVLSIHPVELLKILESEKEMYYGNGDMDADLEIKFSDLFKIFLLHMDDVDANETINAVFKIHRSRAMKSGESRTEIFIAMHPNRNRQKFEDDMNEIADLALQYGSVITKVLLDYTSTILTIEARDTTPVLQSFEICSKYGKRLNFTCGLIYDNRNCIHDNRIFGSINAVFEYRRVSPMKVVNIQTDTPEEFYLSIYECLEARTYFDGYIIGESVDLQPELGRYNFNQVWAFHPETLVILKANAPKVDSIMAVNISATEKKPLRLYSNPASRCKSSVVVQLDPKSFVRILDTNVEAAPGTACNLSFLETFHRFYLSFQDKNEIIAQKELFSLVANYNANITHQATNRTPIQLWISFTSSSRNLSSELVHISKSVTLEPIETILLEYGTLRLTTQDKYFIEEDIKECNNFIGNSATSLSCGFLFYQRNCLSSKKILLELPFQEKNVLFFTNGREYDDICVKSRPENVRNGYIGGTQAVKINLTVNQFSFNNEALLFFEPLSDCILVTQKRPSYVASSMSVPKDLLYEDEPLNWKSLGVAFSAETSMRSGLLDNLPKIMDASDRFLINSPATERDELILSQFISIIGRYMSNSNKMSKLYIAVIPLNVKVVSSFIESIIKLVLDNSGLHVTILIDFGPCVLFNICSSATEDTYNAFDRYELSRSEISKNIQAIYSKVAVPSLISKVKVGLACDEFSTQVISNGPRGARGSSRHQVVVRIHQVLPYPLDLVLYSQSIDIMKIITNGSNTVAQDTINSVEAEWAIIQAFLNYPTNVNKSLNTFIVKIVVTGCSTIQQNHTTISQYIFFWQILSNWAAKVKVTLFMDSALESENDCIKCQCGWWKMEPENNPEGRDFVLRDKQQIGRQIFERMTFSRPTTSKDESHLPEQWIFLVLVMGGVFVVIPLLTAIGIKVFCTKATTLTDSELRDILKCNNNATDLSWRKLLGQLGHLEISKPSIKLGSHRLGEGQSGARIYKGSILNSGSEQIVALKHFQGLKLQNERNKDIVVIKGLIAEIKILSYLGKHDNIVEFFGATTSRLRKGEVVLALELCPRGSLEKHLRQLSPEEDKSGGGNVYVNDTACPTDDCGRWILDIANGMEYLSSKKVVHRDLATRNVLLSGNRTAKLADFGLSRVINAANETVMEDQECLPWRWMPLESLKTSVFNEMTDVWAFGVTIWEIYSRGEVPFGGLSWDPVEFPKLLFTGMRLQKPNLMETELFEIVSQCWSLDPNSRPTFAEVKCSLLTLIGMGAKRIPRYHNT